MVVAKYHTMCQARAPAAFLLLSLVYGHDVTDLLYINKFFPDNYFSEFLDIAFSQTNG